MDEIALEDTPASTFVMAGLRRFPKGASPEELEIDKDFLSPEETQACLDYLCRENLAETTPDGKYKLTQETVHEYERMHQARQDRS